MWCDGLRCVSGIADQKGKGTKCEGSGCGTARAAGACDEVFGMFEEGTADGAFSLM